MKIRITEYGYTKGFDLKQLRFYEEPDGWFMRLSLFFGFFGFLNYYFSLFAGPAAFLLGYMSYTKLTQENFSYEGRDSIARLGMSLGIVQIIIFYGLFLFKHFYH
jgi:hypothetical protein